MLTLISTSHNNKECSLEGGWGDRFCFFTHGFLCVQNRYIVYGILVCSATIYKYNVEITAWQFLDASRIKEDDSISGSFASSFLFLVDTRTASSGIESRPYITTVALASNQPV